MYKDGWWLAMRLPRIPWLVDPEALRRFGPGWNPDDDPVELYYLPDDFSQAKDLAAEHLEKVEELRKLFWEEAERYQVPPLLGGLSSFYGVLPPIPELAAGDHQCRHAQQEQRDRGLHAVRRRVEVFADAGDRDVHVRAGETGDELGQGERNQHPPRRNARPLFCRPGSVILRLRTMIVATTAAWSRNEARQLIVVVIRPPINGPAAAPIPPMPLITPPATEGR